MFDLATSPTSHALIQDFWASHIPIAAVCHGPAALARARLADGSYLLAGKPVTGFSDVEEEAVGLTGAMPFSLEKELNEKSGGKFEKAGEPWGVKVVVAEGGKLITGQNPASAKGVGEALVKALGWV
jgi:putative intracellular protease/amidase